jgi:hypothetical protein
MVPTKKHDRTKKQFPRLSAEVRRRFHAKFLNRDLQELLDSKNAAGGGHRRVERLIEACVELAQLKPQVNFNLLFDQSADKGGRAYQEAAARFEECAQLADTINGLLKRYKAIQAIFDIDEFHEWVPDHPEESDAYTEGVVAMEIMNLFKNGDLARLRKCECGTYFFARSSITRFCSEECRVAYWENSENRKEQKRKRAKEYYHLHKSGKVR